MQQLGAKVRAIRRRENLSQKKMAERLGISASYLNLIEHNRRPLTASLLIKLVQHFAVDLQTFSDDDDARRIGDLREVLSDPLFEGHEVTIHELKEFAVNSPAVAAAMLTLYRSWRSARESASSLAGDLQEVEAAGGLDASQLPSEEVHELIHRHANHFADLEAGADALRAACGGEADYRAMAALADREQGLQVRVVKAGAMNGAVRHYDSYRAVISLSEVLPPRSRNFQLAHQLALLTQGEAMDRLTRSEVLTTDASRALARVALANYFAGAVLMPYTSFLEAARAFRYDVELLGHRFRTSFEQICHRLTTMRRPGDEGVPFHLIRVDMAGNISKRFSASGIRFARFSGSCSRWNVFNAFQTPGRISVQLSRMPESDTYFCIARTISQNRGGYHAARAVHAVGLGCRMEHAKELVYSDGVDLSTPDAAIPIGVTCRLCERMDCTQRAVPAVNHPLTIDEDVRGPSFYAPVVPVS